MTAEEQEVVNAAEAFCAARGIERRDAEHNLRVAYKRLRVARAEEANATQRK